MKPDPIALQAERRILLLRGQKVMVEADLPALYNVETRALKQAVRRNRERFPEDFMFELTREEAEKMVSQSVIPSLSHFGGALPALRSLPPRLPKAGDFLPAARLPE